MPDLNELIAQEHWGKDSQAGTYHVVVVDGERPLCRSERPVYVWVYPYFDLPPADTECCTPCLYKLRQEVRP